MSRHVWESDGEFQRNTLRDFQADLGICWRILRKYLEMLTYFLACLGICWGILINQQTIPGI